MGDQQSKKPVDIFVLTGELSGDKLGYELLKKLSSSLNIEGVLGPHLKTLPIKKFESMESFNFMGLSKPISSIRKILSTFKKIKKHILATNPKIVLLIDLPDINLRMAQKLRKRGYTGKIFQVVCPTIWAWRPKRKKTLEKYFDHLFCLYQFECDLFKDSPLKVSYIGHPLNALQPRKLENKTKLIAVFPGSRKQEVEHLLPDFLNACQQFPDYQIHISVAKPTLYPLIKKITQNHKVTLRSPEEKDQLIKEAHFALSKNGTINLELALSHVPQITCYRINGFERLIFANFFSIYLTHYSLPNILLKKRVIPELIGPLASLKNIEKELNNLINCSPVKESMEADYHRLSKQIKEKDCQDPTLILESNLCD